MDELAIRIKRLVESFPDYTHDILVYRNFSDLQKKIFGCGIETIHKEEDIGFDIEDHLIYTPEASVGVISYNDNGISILNYDREFNDSIYNTIKVKFNPPHKDFHPCTFQDPTLCALQYKIFKAIFGDEWPKYVNINIIQVSSVKVLCNVKEKLK